MSTEIVDPDRSNGESQQNVLFFGAGRTPRPLKNQDISAKIGEKLDDSIEGLENVREALGHDPLDALSRMTEKDIGGVRATLAHVCDDVARIIEVMGFIQETRIMVDNQLEPETNGFKGEAHLDEIKVNVILTLDPQTGMVAGIRVLKPGVQVGSDKLNSDQLQTTISGSEFAKESMVKNWDNDPAVMRQHDAWIESELRKQGRVLKGGKVHKIKNITPGQIPSSRAWVNPEKALRPRWEIDRREKAAARKTLLEARYQTSDSSDVQGSSTEVAVSATGRIGL